MEEYFLPTGPGMAMIMTEIPALDSELQTVISRGMAAGFSLSAVHNHRVAMSPHVWWLHVRPSIDRRTGAQ